MANFEFRPSEKCVTHYFAVFENHGAAAWWVDYSSAASQVLIIHSKLHLQGFTSTHKRHKSCDR